MLILTMHRGDTVTIGNVRVKLCEITKGYEAKLAFQAPPEVKILRSELLTRREPKEGE